MSYVGTKDLTWVLLCGTMLYKIKNLNERSELCVCKQTPLTMLGITKKEQRKWQK